MTINTVVWNEYRHERENAVVKKLYPDGIHACIDAALVIDDDIVATSATLDEPEHGLTQARLDATDVLLWWGHIAHDQVDDAIVERVVQRVWAGMGLIILHSGHFSKVFKRLLGTACNLRWREAGERERLWVVNPRHPIAAGLPERIELKHEEMYGEPFGIPEPLETVLISWFQGGEVFRSGVTYRRGAGNIFYFRPGHETYPTYHDVNVQHLLRNAVRWAYNQQPAVPNVDKTPEIKIDQAPEPFQLRGSSVYCAGIVAPSQAPEPIQLRDPSVHDKA